MEYALLSSLFRFTNTTPGFSILFFVCFEIFNLIFQNYIVAGDKLQLMPDVDDVEGKRNKLLSFNEIKQG